jgi:hypothetical protein
MSDLELGRARTRARSKSVLQHIRLTSRFSILTQGILSRSSRSQRLQKEALVALPVRGAFTIIWLQQGPTLSIH